MTARNPPQSHREIQSHHQNIIKTQRANQIQNRMIIPISGEVPRQIDASIIGQGQRMKIAGGHIPIMSTNRQIRQEIPLRGRTMSNPRDILAQDCINRGIYNSPIVPQSTRGNPQSQYSKSPSHFRDEDLQLQRDRMSVKARSFSYNRMKIHNNQHGHHQVIPDGFPAEQENGDEKFFPKSQENAEAKDQGDEVKELVRLGILPEDYEKISVSDDSD
uniref:Uncharacterized protein n=1 Tax=Euplotes crassus TaxID=5936 RepID=A0A7S3KDD2_EUPCR|mmetsp:Transcript_21941/g.21675  ORF Transcript_21941/g.21675 Transcript_21941/m.21675 type:complete len:217 (+) Transcript_21941:48-698(+)